MLPAISAEACLYADLWFDPLTVAALVLWQGGVIGEQTARLTRDAHGPGVERLVST
jgi:hypothetical protein